MTLRAECRVYSAHCQVVAGSFRVIKIVGRIPVLNPAERMNTVLFSKLDSAIILCLNI